MTRPDSSYDYDELDALLRGSGGLNGAVGMSAIDGLIAALVAAPTFVPPEEWLPMIFGGRAITAAEGSFEDRAVRTVFARYNEASETLSQRPAEYRPIFDQAVAAAGAEVDPRKRADLFDRIAERAEALDAVIASTKGLAAGLARDRQAIEERSTQADRAAQAFRDRLTQAYADPAAAEAAWSHLADERGIAGAVAAVTRDPASLAPLKGRRRFFGLLADRERTQAIAAAHHVPEAGSLAWNTAIARDLDRATSFKLDRIEAGPELTRRRQAQAERSSEHSAPSLRQRAATLRQNADLAELRAAIAHARHIGPDPANPARLAVTWAANRAGPELAALNRLASLYPKAFSVAAAAEFAIRAPLAAAEWQRQHQRSIERGRDRGPGLGR